MSVSSVGNFSCGGCEQAAILPWVERATKEARALNRRGFCGTMAPNDNYIQRSASRERQSGQRAEYPGDRKTSEADAACAKTHGGAEAGPREASSREKASGSRGSPGAAGARTLGGRAAGSAAEPKATRVCRIHATGEAGAPGKADLGHPARGPRGATLSAGAARSEVPAIARERSGGELASSSLTPSRASPDPVRHAPFSRKAYPNKRSSPAANAGRRTL
jgi:hypothetical protein